MAFTFAVLGCSISSRKITKWKVTMCEIHHVRRNSEICTCDPPFRQEGRL